MTDTTVAAIRSTERVVLHELALGIELVDALTRAPISGRVGVYRELPPLPNRSIPRLRPFDAVGGGRFRLRYNLSTTTPAPASDLTFRVVDPDLRYIARRCRVRVRSLADVQTIGAAGQGVPAGRRKVVLALFPGPTYPAVTGATVLRGVVERAIPLGAPAAWARVDLLGPRVPGGNRAPFTHTDGSGAFQLIVTSDGSVPADWAADELNVTVSWNDPPPGGPADEPRLLADPLAGLTVVALPDLDAAPLGPLHDGESAEGFGQHPLTNTSAQITVSKPVALGRQTTATLTIA